MFLLVLKKRIRAFIGLMNSYGRFFKDLSTILIPLNNLLRQNVTLRRSKECDATFQNPKNAFHNNNFLVNFDPEFPLILGTDAPPQGVGAA